MNTVDLINNLLKRSDGALDQLKLHYGPLIRYVITPILPDERDREEVFSDILIRVWDRVGQFDPNHGSWTNWLSTIARNAAIDRARRNPPISSELTETIPAPNSDSEQELLRKERQKTLHMALNSLESSDKALFYRKYYYRQSTAQIAAEYGTTERSIEGRLYRIKRKLRKVLGGDFYDGYHSLGKETYDTNGMVAQMLGQTSSTDVFATFSLPNEGERRRGYVMYELSEMIDGFIISSWFNYIHQHNWFQFPVQTAMEFEMTSFSNNGWAFKTIQTALQFTTHGEIPKLF